MKTRVLIVDDEPLARGRLRALLEKEADAEIVGEAAHGLEAVDRIGELKPDLVFLDIQMPELDGFGVLASIDPENRPLIIFVTAFDQFAVKAFEARALDYLLKPYDRERFQAAFRRAVEELKRAAPAPVQARVDGLVNDLDAAGRGSDRFAIKSNGRILLIRPGDIDWVGAADNYVELHIGSETHLIRETISAWEKRLGVVQFLRISRSAIVNLDRVKELQPLFHGEYAVILFNGVRLTLARSQRDKVQQLLGRVS